MRNISIFLPRPTPFYEGVLAQMLRAFESLGIEAQGLCRHLGASELNDWCGVHKPDAIFEMNRPRCEVPFLPPKIRHVVWVVDFNGRPISHFEGSDITYLFSPGWMQIYPHDGFHRYFPPGADPFIYGPRLQARERDIEASFVGHIPRPWTPEELDRDVTGRGALTFRDLLGPLEEYIAATHEREPTIYDSLEVASQWCERLCGVPLHVDDRLKYDIRNRIVRDVGRRSLLDGMLASCDRVHVYGPTNWAEWPAYAPAYRGYLDDPADLADVYHRSTMNFHQGEGLHFRSMDAMSCGGLLLYREHWHDQTPGGMATTFEPGVHYLPFTPTTLPETVKRVREHPEEAQVIRANAAAEIARTHTWRHRFQGLLDDLAAIA